MQPTRSWSYVGLCLGLLVLSAASASAQSYVQLQVLLPGESAAPGTAGGRLGTPRAQTVGVPFDVTLRACDASWNTVATVTNIVRLGSSDQSAQLPGSLPLVDGVKTVTVTLNAAGSFSISVQDESDPTIPEAASSFVDVMLLHGFVFSRISQKNQYAGQPMAIALDAVDPNGGIVTGFSGSVRLAQITSFGDGRISPPTVTLSNGTWSGSVTLYRADETSINRGNVNIFAFLEADPARNGTSDPFTVHPGTFARVQVIVPGQAPLPGSIEGISGSPATQGAGQDFNVEVYATDAYWNPVPSSDIVRIASSDPLSSPVSASLSNGFRQFTYALATVGTQTLTVSDASNAAIQGMTSAGIPVIASAVHHFVIEPFASPVGAGEPVSVTIRATDASGNTLPDYTGNAILSANTGPGSITPEAIVFSNGVWSGSMAFRGAGGAVSFTCADFAAPPHIGTSASFEVLPGPYVGLQVLLPGQTPMGGTPAGVSGTPMDQNAGSAFDVTLRAVDAFWNRVPGIAERVGLTSSDPFAAIAAEATLVNGQLTLPATLFAAGSQTLSAVALDSAGIEAHTSSAVEVLPGSYARLLIVAPGQALAPGTENGRVGEATDQSINFAFTVQVFATDMWWNPVGAVSDVVRISSSDPLAQLPSDAALQDGHVALNVRLSTGGFQQITVTNLTQPAMTSSTTQVRAISSGFHLEAEVSPRDVQAGEPFSLTVRVTNDAGSIIQEINSFVDIEVLNASTRDPGRGTLLTTRFQLLQGQRTVSQIYTFAESILLVISDDAGNVPAVTEPISVSPGPPERLVLASDPTWVRGNRHATLNATVVDAFDNGVPAQPVEFTLLNGLGALSPIDSATNEQGVAQADFLSPRTPMISRVRAQSNAFADEIDIETALVDPGAPGGTIASYPNPFHPGESPTTIAYKLADDASVTLKVFTLSGGLVLQKSFKSGGPGGLAGLNEFVWDGRNGKNEYVSSGGYLLVVEATGAGETLHVMRRKIAAVR